MLWHEQLPVKKGFFCDLVGHFSWFQIKIYWFPHHVMHMFYVRYDVRNPMVQVSGQPDTYIIIGGRKNEFLLILPKWSMRKRQNILSFWHLFTSFLWSFWLQGPLEFFLNVLWHRSGYLEVCLRSGLSSALWITTVRRRNPFLFDIVLPPPLGRNLHAASLFGYLLHKTY